MADRIIGFTTTCLIGILTNRAFQIGSRTELTSIETAFTANNINWHRDQDADWLIEPLKFQARNRNYNQSILDTKEYFAVNTIDDFRLQDKLLRRDLNEVLGGLNEFKTVFLSSNRGKTIRIFENDNHNKVLKEMGLTPYNAFGCLVNYLLKPKEDIFIPVLEEYKKMTSTDTNTLKITIQIRVGDWLWTSTDHNSLNVDRFLPYFSCAQQIEDFANIDKKYTNVIWYLLTESIALRKSAKQRYGDKILTNLNITTEHSSKEQSVCETNTNCAVSHTGFKTAAAEWWLMGYSDYFVITRYSGYGRSAAFRSLKKDNIYTVASGKHGPFQLNCDNKSFTDMETLSFDWSGI
jgi:hypothetical protein